jgi:hypothetical protein
MARRVTDGIGLHLDDSAADPIDEQRHADELRCDLVDAACEEVDRELQKSF